MLGHRRLNSTMIYAKAHDETVAKDYFTAMETIETKLENALTSPEILEAQTVPKPADSTQWRTLLTQLQADPLTNHQQELLAQLHQEILQLTKDMTLRNQLIMTLLLTFLLMSRLNQLSNHH